MKKRLPTLPRSPERVRLEIIDAASNGCEQLDLTTTRATTPEIVEELLEQAAEHDVELLLPNNTLADQIRDASDERESKNKDPLRDAYTVVDDTSRSP